MNKLRNRIKQLEHQNKEMRTKCRDFDEMRDRLRVVVRLYEGECAKDGWTDGQLAVLRGDFINKYL